VVLVTRRVGAPNDEVGLVDLREAGGAGGCVGVAAAPLVNDTFGDLVHGRDVSSITNTY
jgi:hypothetical protein